MQGNRLSAAICLALLSGMVTMPMQVHAQDAGAQAGDLDRIQVLGSRRVQKSTDVETPVPVDVLPMAKQAEQGAEFDLAQSLQYASPSFNSTRQTGADGADLVDGAALRGMGSDQTLVLVNGKRRHTVALTNVFGARDRGNTGTDFNSIPMLAVDRVEVLRDGASAQYGSDAIAGVINIALKTRKGCESILGYGQYTRGDGKNWIASAYCGFQLGEGGSLSVTGEWQDRGRSDRSDSIRIIGDSKVRNGTVWLNGQAPLGEVATFYYNAGMQSRASSSAAWAREGVGSGDIPSRNSAAMYPDGFVPFIDGDIQDRHVSVGLRTSVHGWDVDLSNTWGSNSLDYTINHTLNASIANFDLSNGGKGVSPSSFGAGGLFFSQNTTNLDVSRYFDGWMAGVNVAFGLERRAERYRISPGERGSYADYDGPGGGNAGSQGFPGFQPSDAINATRSSWAAYADMELGITPTLMADIAMRYEDYSDFGDTLDGKIAVMFKASDTFRLRGSLSSGFRAPSLQQKYFSQTFSDIQGGVPVIIALARNDGAIATAAGIPSLKQETSRSGTLGFVWTPNDSNTISVDAYRIDITDRIVLSGLFYAGEPLSPALPAGVQAAQFFINSVNTTSKGVDITWANDMQLWGGKLHTALGVNIGKTRVTDIHAPTALKGAESILLSDRERRFLEQGGPSQKATLGFDWSRGPLDLGLRVIYFGSMEHGSWSGPPMTLKYAPRTSADVSASYAFTPNLRLTVGASNVLDVFPSKQDPAETDNGHVYDSVQFGLNGASWFTRLSWKF